MPQSSIKAPLIVVDLNKAFGSIAKKIIENILLCGYFSDEDIRAFLRDLTEYADEVAEKILQQIDMILREGGLKLLFLNEGIDADVAYYTIVPANICHETEEMLRELFDEEEYDILQKIVIKLLKIKHVGGLIYDINDEGPAVAELVSIFDLKPDEVIDKFDYKYTYTGVIYERYGQIWLAKVYSYINYTREGHYVGVQKGLSLAAHFNIKELMKIVEEDS